MDMYIIGVESGIFVTVILVKEMDYLRRSAKNPIIRQNIGKTNTIIQESEEAKIRWFGYIMRWEDTYEC